MEFKPIDDNIDDSKEECSCSTDPIDVPMTLSDDNDQELCHIRRPPNAFMIFGQQFRKVLAKKFTDLSNKEISKLLGNEWQRLDQESKDQYHKLAEEANREHLLKYPGYYYSPLEARQRKAERKQKLKMSKTEFDFTDGQNNQFNGPFVRSFYGNRLFLFGARIHPILRHPMFGYPMHPRMCFGPQFIRFRPNYSFGSLVRMSPYPMPLPLPYLYVDNSIKSESIDVKQVSDQLCQQMSSISETKSESDQSHRQQTDLRQSQDIGHLSSLLPPMHNPGTEVTTVHFTDSLLTEQTNERIVTKMVNAVVQQEYGPTIHIKEDVTQNRSKDLHDIDSRFSNH